MSIEIKVEAIDGFLLSAKIFKPIQEFKGVMLICPGLGIPKEFYYSYCSFLAHHGYVSLVFDYRGIGKNIDRRPEVNLRNWGLKDIPGILNYIKHQYPDLKIYLIGHSIGGQIAGLVGNYKLVERFIFISSTGGYYQEFKFPLNLYTYFLFYIQIPMMVFLFGYMPQSLTYRGVAISKGVAREWADWSRKKEYISAVIKEEKIENYYADIYQKIDWIWFEDDAIATDEALQSMMRYYPNAELTKHPFSPKSEGQPRIGHSGFFGSKAKEAYWEYPLKLIEE